MTQKKLRRPLILQQNERWSLRPKSKQQVTDFQLDGDSVNARLANSIAADQKTSTSRGIKNRQQHRKTHYVPLAGA
jgi:hypothetical protein